MEEEPTRLVRTPRHIPQAAASDPEERERLIRLAEQARERSRRAREQKREERTLMYQNLPASYLRSRGLADIEAAAACPCHCHPDAGTLDMHQDSVCGCQQDEETRKASRKSLLQSLGSYTHEQQELSDAHRRKIEEAAENLRVSIEQEGGAAPYQILGSADGTRFYLRERHGEWRLTVPDEKAGPQGDPVGGPNGTYVIAEGHEDDLYSDDDPAKPLKTAVAHVRAHNMTLRCTHPDAKTYCPDCGKKQ